MKVSLYGDLSYFWQWDSNRKLVVEDDGVCSQVHFCNGTGPALVCPVRNENGLRMADVPNILLQKAEPIKAYLYTQAADGTRTRSFHRFAVIARSKPEEYVYTETEVLNYSSLVARIDQIEQNGVSDERITEAVEDYLKDNPITSGASIFYSSLSFEYNAGSMLSLFNCDKQEIRRNGREVQVGDLIIFGNLSLGIVEKVTDIYVIGSLYASLKGESGSGGGLDATIDGETLVFAESSTATIENETLIL
jgi:hypothetical protein